MKRLSRNQLVEKIIRAINLPPSKESQGYFTLEQLKELLIKLEGLIAIKAGEKNGEEASSIQQ